MHGLKALLQHKLMMLTFSISHESFADTTATNDEYNCLDTKMVWDHDTKIVFRLAEIANFSLLVVAQLRSRARRAVQVVQKKEGERGNCFLTPDYRPVQDCSGPSC